MEIDKLKIFEYYISFNNMIINGIITNNNDS